jgi:hypothetical protein
LQFLDFSPQRFHLALCGLDSSHGLEPGQGPGEALQLGSVLGEQTPLAPRRERRG